MIYWDFSLTLRIDTLFHEESEGKASLVRKEIGLAI
jgi:hypothetical protein